MTANRIIKGLYVGDYIDAHNTNGKVDVLVNVLESRSPVTDVAGELHIPIAKEGRDGSMHADIKQLNKVASIIDKNLKAHKMILLHCAAGSERSPLTIMWYLHVKKGVPLNVAYEIVKARRPQTRYCLNWIPGYDPSS